MNRTPVCLLALGTAMLAGIAFISAPALASGAPRYDARGAAAAGTSPAAGTLRPARQAGNEARRLSTDEMIYLHRSFSGAAAPVSAAAAWSLALSGASASDARAAERSRQEAITQSGERHRMSPSPVRKRNPA